MAMGRAEKLPRDFVDLRPKTQTSIHLGGDISHHNVVCPSPALRSVLLLAFVPLSAYENVPKQLLTLGKMTATYHPKLNHNSATTMNVTTTSDATHS
jgi:hypothetical protein